MSKPKEQSFDLSAFDTVSGSSRGAEVQLTDLKTGAPMDVFIKVLGTDSEEWRAVDNEWRNRRLKIAFKAQRSAVRDADILTAEQSIAQGIRMLTAVTVGWRTGDTQTISYRGEELACNPINVERIYTELPAVRQQVDEFIGDIANFI
jgi:hypothetical protein